MNPSNDIRSGKSWTVTDGTRTYTFVRSTTESTLIVVECGKESIVHSIEDARQVWQRLLSSGFECVNECAITNMKDFHDKYRLSESKNVYKKIKKNEVYSNKFPYALYA